MKKATIYDYARICESNKLNCECCPLSRHNNGTGRGCGGLLHQHTDKMNEIVLNWCKEHPIETRQDNFLKVFPNADISYEGYLEIKPCNIDKSLFDNETCTPRDCEKCKKEYWLTEIEE